MSTEQPITLSPARIAQAKDHLYKEIEALRTMEPIVGKHVRSEIVGRLSVLMQLGLLERDEVLRLEELADKALDEGEDAAAAG
jgi:hypothetical protein